MEKQKYFGSEALSRLANIVNTKDADLQANIDAKADTSYVDSKDRGHDLALAALERKDKELSNSIAKVREDLEPEINNLKSKDNDLSEDIKQAKIDLGARIDTKAEKAYVDSKDGELSDAISQAKTALNTKIEGVESDLKNKIAKKGTDEDPFDKLYTKKIEIDNTDYRNPIVVKNRNPLDVCTNLNADMLDGHDYDEIEAALDTKADTTYVDSQILAAKDEIIGGAEGTYTTIKDIQGYIQEHQEVFEALNSSVYGKANKSYVDEELDKKADKSWVNNKLDTEYYDISKITDLLSSKLGVTEANNTFQTKEDAETAERNLQTQIDDKVSSEEGGTYVKLDGSREMTGTLKATRGIDVGNAGIYKATEGFDVAIGGQMEYHFGAEALEPLQSKNDLGSTSKPWDVTYTNRIVVKSTTGAPISVDTKELCTNLNADQLDGHDYEEISGALSTKATKGELNDAKQEIEGKIDGLKTEAALAISLAKEECKNYTDTKFDSINIPDGGSSEDINEIKDRLSTIEQNYVAKDDLNGMLSEHLELHEQLNGQISSVAGDLATETLARSQEVSGISAQIGRVEGRLELVEGDITRLEGEHTTLQGNIDQVASDYQEADNTLKEEITDAYQAADETLKGEIEGAYKAADDVLKGEIENAYQGADNTLKGEIEDAYKAADNTLKGEIADAYQAADNTLKGEITDAYQGADSAIEAAYQAADDALRSDLNELTTKVNGCSESCNITKNTLTKAISDEETARIQGDKDLAKDLSDETERATNVEDELRGQINLKPSSEDVKGIVQDELTGILGTEGDLDSLKEMLEYLNENGDFVTGIQGKIDQEVKDREAADENIKKLLWDASKGQTPFNETATVRASINGVNKSITDLETLLKGEIKSGDDAVKNLLWHTNEAEFGTAQGTTVRGAIMNEADQRSQADSNIRQEFADADKELRKIIYKDGETSFTEDNSVRKVVDSMAGRIQALETENSDLKGRLDGLSTTIGELTGENTTLKGSLAGALSRIEALEKLIPSAVTTSDSWADYFKNQGFLKQGESVSYAENAGKVNGIEIDAENIAYTNIDNQFTAFQTFNEGAGKVLPPPPIY